MLRKVLIAIAMVSLTLVGAGRALAAPTVVARGSKGQRVVEIQKALNTLGFAAGRADGIFGDATEIAVRSFQARNKLGVDGVVGPRTRAALDAALAAHQKRLVEERRLAEKKAALEALRRRTLEARKNGAGAGAVPEKPAMAQESRGAVYLTFDDGPDPATTPQILDILKANGVKATFFVVGRRAELYPDLVKRMASEGHSVQNHSYSHVETAGGDALEAEIEGAARVVQEITGSRPRHFRPPFGCFSGALAKAASNCGHVVTLWTNIWGSTVSSITGAAFDGSIIMLKERPGETVEILPGVIQGLSDAGYRFFTLTEAAAGEAAPSG